MAKPYGMGIHPFCDLIYFIRIIIGFYNIGLIRAYRINKTLPKIFFKLINYPRSILSRYFNRAEAGGMMMRQPVL
jgi:hypothetical protein